jgi:hypothetical protein
MEGNTPVTLPLHPDVSRCLGHGARKGEWCEKANNCARHMTIHRIDEQWEQATPPYYRACSNDEFLLFMEYEK